LYFDVHFPKTRIGASDDSKQNAFLLNKKWKKDREKRKLGEDCFAE